MSFSLGFLILPLVWLIVSCTGQSPAPIKNSTLSSNPVSAACNELTFEGNVLTKKNILSILKCTSWEKQYPELKKVIEGAREQDINSALATMNDSLLRTKVQRKKFLDLLSRTQQSGELTELSKLLEKSLGDHQIVKQLTIFLEHQGLNKVQKSSFMQMLSPDNSKNIEVLRALKNVVASYESQKDLLKEVLQDEDKKDLRKKVILVLDEVAQSLTQKEWKHISGLIKEDESIIQEWSTHAYSGDVRNLMQILQSPGFIDDIRFLKKSIDKGIVCKNQADGRDFRIDVGQELKHKIDSLAHDERDVAEKTFLHGMTKFLAFTAFCQSEVKNEGLSSFNRILNHAFNALIIDHDYLFLKKLHVLLGEDRFMLHSFLSSVSFEQLQTLLLSLKDKSRDEDFVRSLHKIILDLDPKALNSVSELTKELSKSGQAHDWFSSWSNLWINLSDKEKDNFVKLISSLLDKDMNLAMVLDFLDKLMVDFPDLSPRLAKNFLSSTYQGQVRYLVSVLSNNKVQNELAHFFSQNGLFQFLEILTREQRRRLPPSLVKPEIFKDPLYIERPSKVRESTQTRLCFDALSRKYQDNTDYYGIVNSLPENCLSILGTTGFVGNIYLWMNSTQRFFENAQIQDFHYTSGVWAPGMLNFIFTAAITANDNLANENGVRGLKNNLDEIHRTLTHPFVLESTHLFSRIYREAHTQIDLDQRLSKFIQYKSDAEVNKLIASSFVLFNSAPRFQSLKLIESSCDEISPFLGANPCLSAVEKRQSIEKIIRLLKRKNEDGNSLIKELLAWIHPQAGIPLPFNSREHLRHTTSLDEIIRFLMDLSSPKTNKAFIYRDVSTKVLQGSTIDRLEVLIRDVSFNNNFYGAYFKNKIAGSNDFRNEIIKSEKLLNLLQATNGPFRWTKSLPADSKLKLKNVSQSYSSLLELTDYYSQPDGSTRTYGPFIQSLLAAIGNSSSENTKDYHPYRPPNEKVSQGHNGLFLTEIVKMSGLRNLALFTKTRFGVKLEALESPLFKQINSNLIARHDLNKLQLGFQYVLDKYFDNDRNQLNLLLHDVIEMSEGMSLEEQEQFEEIGLKLLALLSDNTVSTESIVEISKMLEIGIKYWPEVRVLTKYLPAKMTLLKALNSLTDRLVANPIELDYVLSSLVTSDFITQQELETLIQNESLVRKTGEFINHLFQENSFSSSLNWTECLKMILSRSSAEWTPIRNWMGQATSAEKLSVSVVLQVLGEKEQGEVRLKFVMDELFLNHRSMLLQFLDETFPSLLLENSN